MELPLQRVSVAQCDRTAAGGSQAPISDWEALKSFQSRVQVFRKAWESVKRQDGVGATSKGQRRPVRP